MVDEKHGLESKPKTEIINTARNASTNISYGSVSASTSTPAEETPEIAVDVDVEINGLLKESTVFSRSRPPVSTLSIAAILSTAFTYGCTMTTLFLVVLPVECQRIESESMKYQGFPIRKSIALGGFAAIAGLAQLVTPLIGLLSDSYDPYKLNEANPNHATRFIKRLGKRLPYWIFGAVLMIMGLSGQLYSSMPVHKVALIQSDYSDDDHFRNAHAAAEISPQTEILAGAWIQYTIFYAINMIGINIAYTIMIAFIPDYIPHSQTGVANGTLALMAVLGSLFGFAMFHLVLGQSIINMYKMYVAVALISALVTYMYVFERERTMVERDLEGEEEKESNTNTSTTSGGSILDPSLLELIYALLYEPIATKTKGEIMSAFWIDISHHRDFFVVTISRFFYYMGISTQTFFLYFIHDELRQTQRTADPEATVALLAILGQSAGAITCYPVGIISDQYFNSRRKPFVYISCICLGLGNLALVFCTELKQMMLVVTLLGASNGIYLTMDTSLAVDTLDIETGVDNNSKSADSASDALKMNANRNLERDSFSDIDIHALLIEKEETSKRWDDTAQLLGVWGVFGFIGSAAGPLIGGIILLTVGRKDTDPDHFYSLKGYEYLFSLTALYFLCSALSLAFVQKRGV